MNFHELTKRRTITTGDGVRHIQNGFVCPVHGWFDTFAFPDAAAKHAGCGSSDKSHGAGLEIPKAMKKAA